MAIQETMMKPAIKIYINETLKNEKVLKEAVSGVEEESIPYEILTAAEDDAASLSYRAAAESIVEVGIGIAGKEAAVHYKKLPESLPLFKINYLAEEEKIRSICSNAARLVKGTPFIAI